MLGAIITSVSLSVGSLLAYCTPPPPPPPPIHVEPAPEHCAYINITSYDVTTWCGMQPDRRLHWSHRIGVRCGYGFDFRWSEWKDIDLAGSYAIVFCPVTPNHGTAITWVWIETIRA